MNTKTRPGPEIAPAMLRDVGCEFVLVGHSERRALYRESSEVIAAKFVSAQAAGLKPVLCLGETLAEREAGDTERVIDEQLKAVVTSAGAGSLANAVIAYRVSASVTPRTRELRRCDILEHHPGQRQCTRFKGVLAFRMIIKETHDSS